VAEMTEKEKRQQEALERAREARIAVFANGADARPKSDPVPLPAETTQDAPQPVIVAAVVPEPMEAGEAAAGGPTDAPELAEPTSEPVEAAAPAPRPARRAAKPPGKAAPWADAHPRVTVPFTTKLPEVQHKQLTWLKENMPNTSIQKIVAEAITEKVAKLLREYYE
jgi:hypothetical protein